MAKKPIGKSGKPKKPKRKKLTVRQRAFVRAIPHTKTLGEAAIVAGFSPKNPGQSAHQALIGIQAKMPEIMDAHGLTDSVLIENYLKPLLTARETKFFQKDGKIKETRVVEALSVRRETLHMAFMLKGSYAPRDEQFPGGRSGPTVIILDVPRPGRPTIDVTPKQD